MKWKRIDCKGNHPDPRFGHSGNIIDTQMFIFGGYSVDNLNKPKYFNDIYILDLVDFSWLRVDSL